MIKKLIFVLISTIFLTSCSSYSFSDECPPKAIIEWVDMVMINDIKYESPVPDAGEEEIIVEKGKKIGEVQYKMADDACTNHKTKNGDAAYLEKGTNIYEMKGYPSALAVVADDRVFVAVQNQNAKTAKELLPLQSLVKNIYIESTEDGSRLHTFSDTSKNQFIEAWKKLTLAEMEEKHQQGERVFLEIELNNGVSFRLLYWADSNVFHIGVTGNTELKKIIEEERTKL
ncbi:hypothetical protein [Robertmurraya kyonggiensis]|uniref:Lipoprotein n=1 Tax=Robertmurraya kyonggiensis TaxID=1037680 RepID=A0A4U1DAI9_9BACI|nr:hypothetical protein [Robertmurraya kyonggiensis]TKC19178.1 hypothetical protein FA727_06455 [Robertmurraya kyonggiensis]